MPWIIKNRVADEGNIHIYIYSHRCKYNVCVSMCMYIYYHHAFAVLLYVCIHTYNGELAGSQYRRTCYYSLTTIIVYIHYTCNGDNYNNQLSMCKCNRNLKIIKRHVAVFLLWLMNVFPITNCCWARLGHGIYMYICDLL